MIEAKEVPKLHLSTPDTAFKNSYLEAAQEFESAGEWSKEKLEKLENGFEAWIQKLKDNASGKDVEEGYVPSSAFWLVEGDKYIGDVRIRHTLTERLKKIGGNIGYTIRPSERGKGYATQMLKMALQKAAELDLDEVLLTCDEDNVASRKVIEANGGELLESNVKIDESPVPIRRYKITLQPQTEN